MSEKALLRPVARKLHAGNCTECDQSHDQGILDKVLTFFALDKITDMEIQFGAE